MLNTEKNEIVEAALPIGEAQIRAAMGRFQKYKNSKKALDDRLKANEKFWRMRHWDGVTSGGKVNPTGWLLNAVHSKHADMMDGYPEPSFRAKEQSDVREAKMLSEIVPVVLETAGFKVVYDKVCLDKINKGTGVYGIYWDSSKNFGKGDISIEKVNLLNLYFEPGIENIQDSKEVFLLAEMNIDEVKSLYPEVKHIPSSTADSIERYDDDENIDRSGKCIVYDWYYKKWQNGRSVLHYCKFVGENVLYASENDTKRPQVQMLDPMTSEGIFDERGMPVMQDIDLSIAEKGWYEHGQYPFVFDVMFPVEASPCGLGYTDLFKGTQEDIDELKHAIINNALICSNPKFFYSKSGGLNLDDYADPKKTFIPVEGNLDCIMQVQPPQIPSITLEVMMQSIEELKEVTGNRDVNNGSTSSGVTAASAIAALQEHAGKLSRHSIQNTYETDKSVCYQVVELIRQFYSTERQFRITGEKGEDEYVSYSNVNIRPQSLGNDFGVEAGERLPQFDIIVTAAKATSYSKLSQNEFALQLYGAGVFNPANADVVLPMLQMMDFDDKDKVIQSVEKNATLLKMNQYLAQLALGLASKHDPMAAAQLMAMLQGQQAGMQMQNPAQVQTEITPVNSDGTLDNGEHSVVEKARERSQNSTQPT